MIEQAKYAIICVDDDPLINFTLSHQLKKIIDEKTTIVECFLRPELVVDEITKLTDNGIEVIFSFIDFQMPNINGAELVLHLKNKHPNLVCFMLSGQANDLVIRQMIEKKLLEKFIEKPWNEEDLINTIHPFLPN